MRKLKCHPSWRHVLSGGCCLKHRPVNDGFFLRWKQLQYCTYINMFFVSASCVILYDRRSVVMLSSSWRENEGDNYDKMASCALM